MTTIAFLVSEITKAIFLVKIISVSKTRPLLILVYTEVDVQDANDTTTPKPAPTSKSSVRNETTTTILSTTRISTPTSFNSTEEVNSTLILTYHVSGGSTNGMLQRSLYVVSRIYSKVQVLIKQ